MSAYFDLLCLLQLTSPPIRIQDWLFIQADMWTIQGSTFVLNTSITKKLVSLSLQRATPIGLWEPAFRLLLLLFNLMGAKLPNPSDFVGYEVSKVLQPRFATVLGCPSLTVALLRHVLSTFVSFGAALYRETSLTCYHFNALVARQLTLTMGHSQNTHESVYLPATESVPASDAALIYQTTTLLLPASLPQKRNWRCISPELLMHFVARSDLLIVLFFSFLIFSFFLNRFLSLIALLIPSFFFVSAFLYIASILTVFSNCISVRSSFLHSFNLLHRLMSTYRPSSGVSVAFMRSILLGVLDHAVQALYVPTSAGKSNVYLLLCLIAKTLPPPLERAEVLPQFRDRRPVVVLVSVYRDTGLLLLQQEFFRSFDIKAVFVGRNTDLLDNSVTLFIVTPDTLRTPRFMNWYDRGAFTLAVVWDDADTMISNYTFRKGIRTSAAVVQQDSAVFTWILSAGMS